MSKKQDFEDVDYSQVVLNSQSKETYEELVLDKEVSEDEISNEKPTEIYTGVDGTRYTAQEWFSPAIVGGPTRQEVEEWKKRYENVYFIPFDSEVYIFRCLARPEYREIIRDPKLTALDREERIAEKCVLYPRDFSAEKMEKTNAGIPSLISEVIMEKSGFVAKTGAIKL